jgi:hypothetical protein
MPVELQVIRAAEFIRLDSNKHLDLAASNEVLRSLAQACRKRGVACAMLDLRTVPVPAKPRFTTTELAALVGTFREAGFSRQQRLAILYRHDVHGGVRNFAFISRMRGLQVRAFNEFEQAFNWLSQEAAWRAIREENAIPIRIAKVSSEVKKLPVSMTVGSPGGTTARPVRRTTSK